MDLSDFFITQAQAIDFATKLTVVIGNMYTTQFSIEKALAEQFGLQKKDVFLKLFRENSVNTTSTTHVQDFLKKIQETIHNLQLVDLTIAFEPTEEILKAISQWFFATYNKQFLLAIHVNHLITAGVLINSNGKYKDYSFGKQFQDYITQKLQQAAPELI